MDPIKNAKNGLAQIFSSFPWDHAKKGYHPPGQGLVIWKGPVSLGATGVMVIDEGHSVLPSSNDVKAENRGIYIRS